MSPHDVAAAARAPAAAPTSRLPSSLFLTMMLIMVPAAVLALAAVGPTAPVTGLIAVASYGLIAGAHYSRRLASALPVASAAFLALTVATLPFNSPAFIVDFWSMAALFFLSWPRPRERAFR